MLDIRNLPKTGSIEIILAILDDLRIEQVQTNSTISPNVLYYIKAVRGNDNGELLVITLTDSNGVTPLIEKNLSLEFLTNDRHSFRARYTNLLTNHSVCPIFRDDHEGFLEAVRTLKWLISDETYTQNGVEIENLKGANSYLEKENKELKLLLKNIKNNINNSLKR